MVKRKKQKGFTSVGSYLTKDFNWDKKKYITHEWQEYAYRLAMFLGDKKHKALYMRLAKNTDRAILDEAWGFIKDARKVKSKPRLFMWKVKQLKQERAVGGDK